MLFSAEHLVLSHGCQDGQHFSLGAEHVFPRFNGNLNLGETSLKVEAQRMDVASSDHEFGLAEVDLFTLRKTDQCAFWLSLFRPSLLGIDALANAWPMTRLYTFLPIGECRKTK